ncbi:thiolase family protein [Pengzhenrongella frigida]|uniref:Thiolase family protein n=1 Tax=Pengzhenrongella frigida TaxID=1259133 RepID=A0A4Q5MXQ3_9MICO|nr:thiolase family protein [Cellulomonas sp. HLT2-17]RYV50409.1 thiolase family protein [Cellulomonas sp. HLT2-17]
MTSTPLGRTLRSVVFVDGVRTPFGRAKADGLYAHTRADDLAVKAIREVLRRHPQLPLDRIDEVAIAATTQTGDQGLTLGRTVGLLSGLPRSVPGFAIDRMCAGGMTAVTTTASGIAVGAQDVVLAGGVEHMGRHPMGAGADPNPRFFTERLVTTDALDMGRTAENLHDRFPTLTRARADAFGVASQAKYAAALAAGQITGDLVPVALRDPNLGWGLATADELPRPGTTFESIQNLRTPFRPGGRVTAASSAPLTDGAAACLLAAEDTAAELGLGARMRMVSFAYAGVAPDVMGLGPVPATHRALASAGLTAADIGLFEINEAFAVQVLSFLDAFGIDDEDPRVNPYGGAIAVGHPLASSGIRLMTQLARQFAERPDIRFGLTTMCVGLGQGGTVIWENPHHADYDGYPPAAVDAATRTLSGAQS